MMIPLTTRFVGMLLALVVSPALAHDEVEITVGRTAEGRLMAHLHAPTPIHIEPSVFPGIEGFATGLIGFHSADTDEPAEDFYSLVPAADIRAVLVSIDPGIEVLNNLHSMMPGDSMEFGNPFFDYHPLFHIPVADAGDRFEVRFIFRDHTDTYSPSEELILVFGPEVGPPACTADFNSDGGIDGADVSAFFGAWEEGLDEADVNQDGGTDGADVSTFFAAWESGSC
ncbi:MAG: hypothetical protein JSR77_11760 [Planctomycetes bacterium]|nr:hypothetical protein [Planctomycetota bacterium]